MKINQQDRESVKRVRTKCRIAKEAISQIILDRRFGIIDPHKLTEIRELLESYEADLYALENYPVTAYTGSTISKVQEAVRKVLP